MLMKPYQQVLALPGVRSTTLFMFLARLPLTVMGLSLTLHVVGTLDRGYVDAGLVGTATTLGTVLGAPRIGRMIDRHGLRRVVALCGGCSTAFWLCAPHMPFLPLVVLALPAGVIAVPMGSLARQFLTALVPKDKRRAIFSLDTILAEASFVIGPTLGVLVISRLSSTVALTGIGAWIALASVMLCVRNPPTRSTAEADPAGGTSPIPLRSWINGGVSGALLVTVGSMFTLIGTELAVVAALQDNAEVSWTGVVIAVMSVASMVGGLVHGAVHRSLPQAVLALLMGLLVVPVGLFDGSWWLLSLALIPMNLLCTPTLAASAEAVTNLAPAPVRGEAMGLQDSASRLGMAVGSPVVGLAIDHGSPLWGFAAAGLGGVLLAVIGGIVRRSSPVSSAPDGPAPAGSTSISPLTAEG